MTLSRHSTARGQAGHPSALAGEDCSACCCWWCTKTMNRHKLQPLETADRKKVRLFRFKRSDSCPARAPERCPASGAENLCACNTQCDRLWCWSLAKTLASLFSSLLDSLHAVICSQNIYIGPLQTFGLSSSAWPDGTGPFCGWTPSSKAAGWCTALRQMRGQTSDTAAVHATCFTQLCLEQLRRELYAFALDKKKDQWHTPRNLLLAMVAEVSGCPQPVCTAADSSMDTQCVSCRD